MCRFLRFLPLLIVALWLPLQPVAAAVMPGCKHASAGSMRDHCAAHEQHAAADEPASGCDACGTCQLASASVLPASAMTQQEPDVRDRHAVPPAPTFSSHTPFLQDRPPRIA